MGDTAGQDAVTWRKSTFSAYNGSCVEVADLGTGMIGVRDSKNPASPFLTFPASEWNQFLATIRVTGR